MAIHRLDVVAHHSPDQTSPGSLLPPAINTMKYIDTPPPVIDMVIPGLPRGAVGLVYGPGGVGKSFLFLSIALAVSTGTDIFGHWPMGGSPGRVLYLAGEDSEDIIGHRLYDLANAWRTASCDKQKAAQQLRDFDQRVRIHSVAGRLPTLAASRGGSRSIAQSTAWIDAIVTAGQGARLIILDPLSRFHQLDENANADMTALIQIIEGIAATTGAAVLLGHHTRKNGPGGSISAPDEARGASAIVDGVRWAAHLRYPYTPSEPGPWTPDTAEQYAVLEGTKVNGGPKPMTLVLERGPGGVFSCIGSRSAPQYRSTKTPGSPRTVLAPHTAARCAND